MGNPLRSLTTLNHRLDHDLFEDVAKVHYKEGIITDFGVTEVNPITLDDTCTVEVDGNPYVGVPIFYHCRPGYYDAAVGTKREDNKALHHSAWGFRAGHKVVVMIREDTPMAVLGHNEKPLYGLDKKAPWPCLDILKLRWHLINLWGQALTIPWHHIHYKASTQTEWTKTVDSPGLDPLGNPLVLPHRARHIFGKAERQMWQNAYYMGDWLLVVGPIAYIFVVYNASSMAGLGGVYGTAIIVFASIWTPEKEESWLRTAARKESRWEQANPLTPVWDLLTEFPYEGMTAQTKFTNTLNDKFGMGISVEGGYAPKWITAEFWTCDWDRMPTDPNTPNTPESGT